MLVASAVDESTAELLAALEALAVDPLASTALDALALLAAVPSVVAASLPVTGEALSSPLQAKSELATRPAHAVSVALRTFKNRLFIDSPLL